MGLVIWFDVGELPKKMFILLNMVQTCSWEECAEKGDRFISGIPFCRNHESQKLWDLVLEKLPSTEFNEMGVPTDYKWLRWLARAMEGSGFPNGLSSAKVASRAFNFSVTPKEVLFSIQRHPAGKTTEERWRFVREDQTWEHLGEKIVESDFLRTDDGVPICPECGTAMDESPGRVKCSLCGFEHIHEHSLPNF